MAAILTPHFTPEPAPVRWPNLRLVHDQGRDLDRGTAGDLPVEPVRQQRMPHRVYRRRRATVALVLAAVVLSVLAVPLLLDGGVAGAGVTDAPTAVVPQVYIVQPGDTLWAIAVDLAPGHDPRRVVDELSSIAGSASLQVGQRLLIPGELVG